MARGKSAATAAVVLVLLAGAAASVSSVLDVLRSPVGDSTMNLVLFENATSRKAVCNDGTPSGYYISKTNSTRWILYLMGGGLCYDYETCKNRPAELISSNPWPKTASPGGIFAASDTNRFSDFNKVIVIYCTSDLYSGLQPPKAPLNFAFYGSNVVPALLADLAADLSQATEVLFTGGSAGGVGTLVNYGVVKATLPNVHVRALPDAGWFLTTMPPYSPTAVPVTEQLEKGMALWNGQPPQACHDTLGKNAWQCYSGPVVYNFMPPPPADMMILKAQTDAWTLGNDGIKTPLDAKEIEWVMELAAEVRETFVLDKVLNVFSADCIYHTSLMELWDALKISNVTLSQAVQSWYFDNQTVLLVDSCVTPACNPSCL